MRPTWNRRWLLASVGALTLTGGIVVAGVASAQSPTPSAAPSASPHPGQGMAGQNRTDFAQRLATALNIPLERVQQALDQVKAQRPAHDQRLRPFDVTVLGPAAQSLGVTAQQLADAITAARQSMMPDHQPGQRQPGERHPADGQHPDRTAFYAAIAQNLGNGITAQQVQAALETLRPNKANRPTPEQMQQRMNEHTTQLAQALGVSVDQLRAAMQSIGGGPGPFGGRHMGRP